MSETRVISASIASGHQTDLKDGGKAIFTVSGDTGAAPGNAVVVGGNLHISKYKSYASTYYLSVLFGGANGTEIARTVGAQSDETEHAETIALTGIQAAALTQEAETIALEVVATSGTGNKANFRTGCSIELELLYDLPTACTPPNSFTLSKAVSNTAVTLSWGGAKAGTANAITGYELQRASSQDGSTWSAWSALTITSARSLSVYPPNTAGSYYKYRIRTRGAAGADFYSEWEEIPHTLRRDHDQLPGFTDDLIAGETPIKALHMQELQNAVATLRAFYGLTEYAFTTITAGKTSLAGWTAHVAEIRAAIDEISSDHETWVTITENRPSAAIMEQLRRVVFTL